LREIFEVARLQVVPKASFRDKLQVIGMFFYEVGKSFSWHRLLCHSLVRSDETSIRYI